MDGAPEKNASLADESGNGRASAALILRLLKLGVRHKAHLAFALVVTIVMQVMAVGEFVSAGLAVDVLRLQADPDAPPPQWPLGLAPAETTPFLAVLAWTALAALLFGLLRAAGYFFARWTNELLAQSIVVDLRDSVYRHLQRLPFSFYDTHDSGTIINRVTADVQSVRDFIQGVLIRAFTSFATLIVFLSAMLAIHVWLTIACLSFVVLQAWVVLRWSRRARPAFRTLRKLTDDVVTRLSEGVQGIRVVRAFGREDRQIDTFESESANARDQRFSIWRMMGNHMPTVQGCGWFAVAVLIGYGGYLVQIGPSAGGIALGSIWVFYGLMRTLAGQLEQIVSIAGQLPDALTGAERVFGILDTEPDITSPAKPVRFENGRARGAVEFRAVTFGYDSSRPVLHNVSIAIEPGETVAIVGPTGSGKTTLLQLIPRFYDPQRGQVLVDGVDVRERDLESLRRSIGFVFQEPYLFSNTIASNIAFGDPDRPIDGGAVLPGGATLRVALLDDLERGAGVHDAAQIACADEFVSQLDAGFETVVGERGATLSGGERQRISIARAVLVEPSILILDDATSAVDATTEMRILNRLGERRGRTTLIVAHRLSTLRRADRVIVLEAGHVVAQGTHDELMATDGHYREAALVQFGFRDSPVTPSLRDGPVAAATRLDIRPE